MYKRAVDLMEAELGTDLVALDPEAGECFGFNGVARDVWRALEVPKRFEELHTLLMTDYEVAEDVCQRELQDLLDEMLSKRLVELAEQ